MIADLKNQLESDELAEVERRRKEDEEKSEVKEEEKALMEKLLRRKREEEREGAQKEYAAQLETQRQKEAAEKEEERKLREKENNKHVSPMRNRSASPSKPKEKRKVNENPIEGFRQYSEKKEEPQLCEETAEFKEAQALINDQHSEYMKAKEVNDETLSAIDKKRRDHELAHRKAVEEEDASYQKDLNELNHAHNAKKKDLNDTDKHITDQIDAQEKVVVQDNSFLDKQHHKLEWSG